MEQSSVGEGGSETPWPQKHRQRRAERTEERADTRCPYRGSFRTGLRLRSKQRHPEGLHSHTVKGEDRDPLEGSLLQPSPYLYEPYREAEDNADARQQVGDWLPSVWSLYFLYPRPTRFLLALVLRSPTCCLKQGGRWHLPVQVSGTGQCCELSCCLGAQRELPTWWVET